MRLVFAPDDVERFVPARDRLIDTFLAWAEKRDVTAHGAVVAALLDFKFEVDGLLVRWDRDHLREVLRSWLPYNVVIPEPDRDAVVPTLHAFLDFLVERRLLDRRSEVPEELHAEVDEQASAFRTAMADERNYSLDKFWLTRMIEHGVDHTDADAVQRFLDTALSGEIPIDQDVLAEIMDRRSLGAEFDEDEEPPRLPPVVLPTDAEVLASAQDSVLLQRFRALVDWVGEGRRLEHGQIGRDDAVSLAELFGVDQDFVATARSHWDLPEVLLTFRWAMHLRLVRRVKNRLVPGKRKIPLLDKPVECWQQAFEAFGELEGQFVDSSTDLGMNVLDNGEAIFEALMQQLYLDGGGPVPVDFLVEVVLDEVDEAGYFDHDHDHEREQAELDLWRATVGKVLAIMETLGAVRLTEIDDPERAERIAASFGWSEPDLREAALTPIALWTYHRYLREQGVDAPAVGELSGEGLDVLYERLSPAAPSVVEAELAGWVAARGPEQASAEAARFIEQAELPTQRLFALLVLDQAGEIGRAVAHRLRAAGGLAGALATGWLVGTEALDPSEATKDEQRLGTVERLALLHEQDRLINALAELPVPAQADLAWELSHSEHPDALDMLDVIADKHPNRKVAKVAANGRLKLRNSGVRS